MAMFENGEFVKVKDGCIYSDMAKGKACRVILTFKEGPYPVWVSVGKRARYCFREDELERIE